MLTAKLFQTNELSFSKVLQLGDPTNLREYYSKEACLKLL